MRTIRTVMMLFVVVVLSACSDTSPTEANPTPRFSQNECGVDIACPEPIDDNGPPCQKLAELVQEGKMPVHAFQKMCGKDEDK